MTKNRKCVGKQCTIRGKNKEIVFQFEDNTTVGNIKKKIRNKMFTKKFLFIEYLPTKILSDYIILKNNGRKLEDSEHLEENSEIEIKFLVKFQNGSNVEDVEIDIDAHILDLNFKKENEMIFVGKTKCKNEKKVRTYLDKKSVVFQISDKKNKKAKSGQNIGVAPTTKIPLNVINNLDGAPENSRFVIEVDPHTSIDNLLNSISKKMQVSSCFFDVYFREKELVRGDIHSNNIKLNDDLTIKSKVPIKDMNEQFVINIKNKETGKTQLYSVDNLQTVEAMKKTLREQYNVNVTCIKLFYDGKELKNERVIRREGFDNGSMLTLEITKVEDLEVKEINVKVRNVMTSDSKRISIESKATISSLKEKVDAMFGISSNDYVISLHGEIMKSENVLSTYNIQQDDELLVSESVLVKYYMTGDSYSAKVYRYVFLPLDKVSDLKERITKKLNLEAKFINLSFDGASLEDDDPLKKYNLENESVIMMVSTLSGGLQ